MSIARERYYRTLYWVAAAYDIILGFSFLFFFREIAEFFDFEAELPEYGGYVHLLAAFVFVIGIAYLYIAVGDFGFLNAKGTDGCEAAAKETML